ncbi:MAG: YbhB/YbcL family Raf kinase inhibitor-like protein [Deltaproteobacteria bacterium]|nr:YbhB/YbcL family Raf kinase inhibitor-like protein [Deltaproteobacteria bacterium]
MPHGNGNGYGYGYGNGNGWTATVVAAALSTVLVGCSQGGRRGDAATAAADPPARLTLTSSVFSDGSTIPVRHTADAEDLSPPLRWSAPPAGTAELALVCHDPDAPRPGGWVHWVIFGLSPALRELPEDVDKIARPSDVSGAVQGTNDFGDTSWGGPSPPRGHGVHHYHFVLYALDRPSGLARGARMAELESAIRGHILARGELVGTYERR